MRNLLAIFIFLSVLVAQNKPLIGIGEILSPNGSKYENWRTELEQRLVNTDKFDIIERQRLNDILREQGLGASGIVDGSGTIGGISGVDYLVYGTVTRLDSENVGETGYKKVRGKLSIKVVDVTTGKIVINRGVSASKTAENNKKGVGSVRKEITKKMAKYIAYSIFPIKVAGVDGNQVYINYGKVGINSSGGYQVFKMGGGFKDPDTGELIGAKETYIGLIDIKKREEKYSIGKLIHSLEPIQIGDQMKWLSEKNFRKMKKKYKIK